MNDRFHFFTEKGLDGNPILEQFGRGIKYFPETIYKFRSWDSVYHKEVIRNLTLFAASSALFNDPFDSSLNIELEKILYSKSAYKKAMQNAIKEQHPNLGKPQRRQIIKDPKTVNVFNEGLWAKENERRLRLMNHVKNNVGVISFAGNRDNILLWSHYADSHKGFCVGFDRDKYFNESLKSSPTNFMRVLYSEQFPTFKIANILDDDSILQMVRNSLYTKSLNWSYEGELRSFFLNKSNFNLNLDPSCFKEIIFGCKMPEDFKSEILLAARNTIPKVKIYQAQMHSTKFELTFNQIL